MGQRGIQNMISGQRPTAYGTTDVLLADGTTLLDTDEDEVFEIFTSGVIIRPV